MSSTTLTGDNIPQTTEQKIFIEAQARSKSLKYRGMSMFKISKQKVDEQLPYEKMTAQDRKDRERIIGNWTTVPLSKEAIQSLLLTDPTIITTAVAYFNLVNKGG